MTLQDFVIVTAAANRWVVRIVEQGVMTEREVALESHAVAWASGQRIRLGATANKPATWK